MINNILAFQKNGFPSEDPYLNKIHIFGSSSAGNSVYFKEFRVLIDLGLPYKRYEEYNDLFFMNVDYIILTHEHGDHLNPATLIRILKSYPHIKILISRHMMQRIMSPQFAKRIKQDKLKEYPDRFQYLTTDILYNRDNAAIIMIPHLTSHGDIVNVAIEMTCNNKHILYATDLDEFIPNSFKMTNGLPHDTTNLFDVICLEANYNAEILNNYIAFYPDDNKARGNLRHVSEEESWAYTYQFLKPTGVYVPLHGSASMPKYSDVPFGTLLQPASIKSLKPKQ